MSSKMSSVQLHPESASFLEMVKVAGPIDVDNLTVEEVRAVVEAGAMKLRGDYDFHGLSEDLLVDGVQNHTIPITVMRSAGRTSWDNVMIFFHGGGWVWGNRNTHNRTCEMIAQECDCVVVNVEYRLAPEHKYPACYLDAQAVVQWCISHKESLANNQDCKIGVAGDSAGGNIAASVSHMVKGIDYQILIYPSLTLQPKLYESFLKYGEGYVLTIKLMNWFRGHFLNQDQKITDILGSPMNRTDFKGQPASLFIVAECDALADQSADYQTKLDAAGVLTDMHVLPGVIHGYINRPGHFKETVDTTVKKIKGFLSRL